MPDCCVVKAQKWRDGMADPGGKRLRAVGWEAGAGGKQRCLLLALHCGTGPIPGLPRIHQSPPAPPGSSHPFLPLAFIPPAVTAVPRGKRAGTAKF